MAPIAATPLSRVSSQSNLSDYSIDLDALGPSEQHDSSLLTISKPNNHAVDVVHSEDIDGPTDFTQNMEFWMSARLPNVLKPTRLEGEKKEDLEKYIESDESISDSHGNGSPQQKQRESEETEKEAEPTALRSQDDDVDQSMMSDASLQHVNYGGMSFLSDIPEGEGSVASPGSPRTVEPASPSSSLPLRRHPTVEDYEDTPIRPRETRSASSSAIGATLRSPELTMKGNPAPAKLEDGSGGQTSTIKSLEEALSRLRSELAEVRSHSDEEISNLRKEHENHMSKEHTSHQSELRRIEVTWQDRMSQMKVSYEDRISILESQKGDIVRDQAETTTSLEARLKTSTEAIASKDLRISSLEQQLGTKASELQHSKNTATSLQQEMETRVENNRVRFEESEEERREEQERYNTLQSSYERVEAGKMDVEDEVEALEAALESNKAAHSKEISNMKAKMDDSITKVRQELEGEKAHLSLQMDTLREERDDLRAELAVQQRTISEDNIPKPNANTIEKGKELHDLRAQLEEERTRYSRSLQDLESSKEVMRSAIADQKQALEDLQKANSILRSSVQDQELALQDLQDANKVLRSSVQDQQIVAIRAEKYAEDVRAEIKILREDFDAVNAAVDERVTLMLSSREAEWSRKYDVLKKEKGVMRKVLMREWGAKEIGGVSDPQAYRYQFA